jgi:hypothetical protein
VVLAEERPPEELELKKSEAQESFELVSDDQKGFDVLHPLRQLSKYETHLAVLENMGFLDKNVNVFFLEQFKGSIPPTVEALIKAQLQDQDKN